MPCAVHPEIVTGLSTCARCGKEFCGDCIISLRGEQVCGNCKQDAVQDIRSGAPAGLELAGRGARLGAIIIDGMIVTPFLIWYMFSEGRFDPSNHYHQTLFDILLQYVIVPVGYICYEALMLNAYGQTLGKMALGIRVVRSDGGALQPGQSWRRGFLRNLLAITQIGGLVDDLMIFSHTRTTLHDRFARTTVVVGRR